MLSNFENKLRLRFLKKSKNIASKTIDISGLNDSNKNDFDDIFTGKLDFLVVKNFISKPEIEHFLSRLNAIEQENKSYQEKTKTGFFLGKSLLEKNSLDDYFMAAKEYHLEEKRLLGFSFNERIKKVTEAISDVDAVEIPVNNNNQTYLGNSIRVLEANKAAFPAHTDKFVHDNSPKSTEINELISEENMISYFSVIKNAEKGGRLFILQKKYNDTPTEILDELVNGDYTNVQRYIYKHNAIIVRLEQGDLILFDAGQRWHLVEPIYGKTPRITVGCFASFNKEKNKIYYWS